MAKNTITYMPPRGDSEFCVNYRISGRGVAGEMTEDVAQADRRAEAGHYGDLLQ